MISTDILIDIVVPAVGTVFAGIVWAARLEGRVNEHATILEEREKQTDERHQELKDRLQRIEIKLDHLNGIGTRLA